MFTETSVLKQMFKHLPKHMHWGTNKHPVVCYLRGKVYPRLEPHRMFTETCSSLM